MFSVSLESVFVLSDLSCIYGLVMLALRFNSRVKLLLVKTQNFLAVNDNYERLTGKLNLFNQLGTNV